MRKIIITGLMLAILCGCGKAGTDAQEAMDINAYLSGGQDQQGDNLMRVITKALDEKDAELLKSVFSEEAKTSCPELDRQIEELFEYYKGPTLNFKGNTPYATGHTSEGQDESGHFSGGYGYWDIQGEYFLQTKSEKYWITFAFYSNYEAHPEKNGIYTMEIISNDLMETEGVYRHSVEDEKGIYIDR